MAIEIAPPGPDLTKQDTTHQDLPDARRRRRARSALWRLGGWGGTAALALAVLAITTQTQNGSERLQLALALENQPGHAVAMADVTPRVLEKDAETRALEAQVRALGADRDRLNARLASLERNLDDMTGSIKRQAALADAAPAAKSPAPAPSAPATAAAPPAIVLPAIVLPAIVLPANVLPTMAPLAMPASTDTAATAPGTAQTQAATPAAGVVPLPPTRLAAAPANEPAAEPPHKAEFGVDLGGAPNLEVLAARWIAVKANFGPLLAGLYPLAAHDRRPGATDYRLLVGPLPNTAAAARLCGRFAAARVTCRPARFDGERIAQR